MRNVSAASSKMLSKVRGIAKGTRSERLERLRIHRKPVMVVAIGVLVGWTEYLYLGVAEFLETLRKTALDFKDSKARPG